MEGHIHTLRALIEGNRDNSVSPTQLVQCLSELAGCNPEAIIAEALRQSELFAIASGWE